MLTYDKKLKNISRKLRNDSTDAERKLWSKIRKNQIAGKKFTRQKPIGKYIVDFYCHRLKLVIELDGDQHYYEKDKKKDKTRDVYLKEQGLKVLRVANNEIFKNIEGVIDGLWILAANDKNLPNPPSQKERE